jgi:NO-binding membrane sensor protein with MHYT domain/nitrogen-specific signal transduction histidine kinase
MAMLNLDRYFFPVFDRIDPTTAYPGSYNLALVATSVAIAIVAAFVALSISGRIVAAATPLARYAWASAGAISMGGGIWSMHFVGMLAFSLPCGITYDPLGTVLSMIPGALASGIALAAISRADKPGLSRLLVSAVLMGGGIAAMHYAGMAAMRPEALLQYDAGLVAISIVVAVVLAFVSLSIRYQLHRPQTSPTAANIVAASVMGCAIAGMHYTAMQAALFFPLPEAPAYSLAPLSPALLAILITIFTVLIAAATLAATFAGRQSELASILSAEVSRRMCTEVDLRRSETYLAEAQRLSKTGSFGWKIDTDQIFWSKETYRIMEFDETVKPAIDLVLQRTHPDDRELVQAQIDRAVRGEQRYDYEHRLLMPDGTIKYVYIRAHPQIYEGGEEELVGAVMDITAARQAQDALQSAQADLAHAARVTALGEMGASLAHEVNQPLAAVVSNAEASARWLNRPVPEIEEAIAAVGHILKNAHRASEVIRRARQFSKKADPEMVQLDINEVVEEAIALVRHEAHRHRVAMRLDLASCLLPVRGDRIQLQQVIINLVMNGLQATIPTHNRERGLVVHTEQRQSGQVLVSVEDVGIGIEPENADRIFGAFFTTKRDGVGIGLSVCRSIIEAHGGQIWASANAGPGMTFRFAIPVYEKAADAA